MPHDSARHLQRFEDTMAKYHGEIERLVYAAEIHCRQPDESRKRIGRCRCPFVPDSEPHICPLVKIREAIGDHVKQDDVVPHA